MESSEISSSSEPSQRVTFFQLPWEHVVFRHIFPALPLSKIFSLRRVSKEFCRMVENFFSLTFTIDTSQVSSRLTPQAFEILAHRNCCLHSLSLRHSKDWLGDGLLIPVFKNNSHLTKVDLTGCSNLTNASLHVMAVNSPRLEWLGLRDCHWVSEAGLSVVMMNCPNLLHVDLTGCWNLNDDIIMALATSCTRIRYLSLANIYGLTDTCIMVLAHKCSELLHLNIHGCWRVTNDSIRLVGEYCKHLRALQVKDCRRVTEFSLARLRCRGIKIDVWPPSTENSMAVLPAQVYQLNLQN